MFEEFRLELVPDPNENGWTAQFLCSVGGIRASTGHPINLAFTRAHLADLRAGGWQNQQKLREIGRAVWQTLMDTPVVNVPGVAKVSDVWDAARKEVYRRGPENGLRLTFTVVGDHTPPPGGVRAYEIPVEALYDSLSYLGVDRLTPITRTLQTAPDADPLAVAYPLRILVAISTPTGKPKADAAKEKKAIEDALDGYSHPGGPFKVEWLLAPTRDSLQEMLARNRYHMLHFIGHGGFGPLADDPTPQGHLCLHDANDGQSDPVGADTLLRMLLNSGVRLVVLSSCSSGSASPDDPVAGYNPGAFDGVAQRLLAGSSQVAAVVAMQFDLENWAAVKFTTWFYRQLVENTERHLDAVVAEARRQLSIDQRGENSRTWITPVVFSRCRDGKVFELTNFYSDLTEEAIQKLAVIDELEKEYRRQLDAFAGYPEHVRKILEPDRDHATAELERLADRRQQLLGETVRVYSSTAKAGSSVYCMLTLRTRKRGEIGEVEVSLEYPTDRLKLSGCEAADQVTGMDVAILKNDAGRADLLFRVAGDRPEYDPDEYMLGVLQFVVPDTAPIGSADVKVTAATIRRANQPIALRGLAGLLFVQPPPD